MRLLAVRLQNLNSLSGTHEVRFDTEPLAAAGVFLITGATGAGKSTLLDAMTLALYGRAARYGNDKADEMMSRHTAECFAEVDFETGGKALRATWRLRRARGKADGKLQPVERRLAHARTGEILAEKSGEMDRLIEDMTGLDAQRFLRSVLLAQGQFAAFLKAKPNERADLLEKITGTEIYSDLSKLAHETHKAKDETAMRLRERLGALIVLDEEGRAALETNIGEARETAAQLQLASQAAAKHLNEQRELMQRQRELAGVTTDITRLAEASRKLTGTHAEASQEAVKARATLEAAQQTRTAREPVWEQAAGMAAQSSQLEKQLVESRTTYKTWDKEQKEAVQRCEAATTALAAHAHASEALEAWLKQHAADAELAEKLPQRRAAIREWRGVFEHLAEGRRRHAEAAALNTKLAEVETAMAALAQKKTDGTAREATMRAGLDHLSKALDTQREVTRHAEQVAGFDEHRHDLKQGLPCPLCGALEHPFATGKTDFDSQLQAARKLLQGLEQQREKATRELAAQQREVARTEAELAAEDKRGAEMQKRAAELQAPADAALAELEAAETARRVPEAPSPEHAERELSVLEQRAQAFARKRDEATASRNDRQKLSSEIDLARLDESAKSKRLEELKAEGLSLKAKADSLKLALTELLGGKSLLEDRQWHESQILGADKALRDAEARAGTLQTELAAQKARLEQLETRRTELEKQLQGQDAISPAALASLETEAQRLAEAFGTRQKELGSLEQQRRSDEEARQRREAGGRDLTIAEGEALRWGRLKELIGSADGAKFARFAQSLTLRHLIGLANEHLKVLAERYRLMAAPGDDLDLRIVDLYQANTDRPMESLSGGESFLASLALALGLSELASRHHPIDSLFIDEGFGTLDSETLEIALSALENLRSQGKTIGLISHVELLKERLTTQVRVQRGAGGTSRIEIAA
ncbi:MAG: AAA family ATPase [Prosthecobacter sp.]